MEEFYQYLDASIVDRCALPCQVFDDLSESHGTIVCMAHRSTVLPRVDSFFVLMILAANSCAEHFWMHRRTVENAPLKAQVNENVSEYAGGFVSNSI